MRKSLVVLLLLPATLRAQDDGGDGASRYSQPPLPAEAAEAPAVKPVEPPPSGPHELPLADNRSPSVWRLEIGYGQTKEAMQYHATASPNAPALGGYATTSNSATPSTSANSERLDVGPMYGVHPGSRGYSNGFIWGVDIEMANYQRKSLTLPATDADTSGTSLNGTSFQSLSGVQTLAVGMPVGWSFDLSGQVSLEAVGMIHLGMLHAQYTSGENLVYGRNAPLGLFNNDVYDVYGDAEARLRLAWRLESGWEFLLSGGYFYGLSLGATIKDSMTYYQGGANAQAGTYQEKVAYRLNGATASLGLGYSF